MSNQDLPARREVCIAPKWGAFIGPYCFGDLGQAQKRDFEIHLLECDSCWKQVDDLDPAVEVLRSGQHIDDPVFARPVFSIMLNKAFGGHVKYVLPICLAYAALYTVALFVEVAYEFERFRNLSMSLAPLVFLWIFATSVVGLALDWKLTAEGRGKGLWTNLSVHGAAAILLYLPLTLFLPSVPTVQANFQTFTVQAGYLKSILYFLFLFTVFWLPSFHFVIVMQREIQNGRHRMAFAVLMNERWAITPPATIYPRFSALLGLWVLVITIGLGMTFHLFDNLRPNVNLNLFMHLVEIRFSLFFLLGTGCVLWYGRALDVLKRECLALLALQAQSQAVLSRRDPR